jgi:hypothetical protein
LSISTIRKWEKVPETDKYIALWVQYIVLVCMVLLRIHYNVTNTDGLLSEQQKDYRNLPHIHQDISTIHNGLDYLLGFTPTDRHEIGM